MNPDAKPVRRSLGGWHDLLARLPEPMRGPLNAAYGEPGRAYHDAPHPGGMWETWLALGGDPDDVPFQLATAWHDAEYDPAATDGRNENGSGSRLLDACRDCGVLYVPSIIAEAVVMIRATAEFMRPVQRRIRLFRDLDRSGMAVPWEEFADNTRLVRQEARHLTDAQFAAGCTRFFEGILAEPQVFTSGELPVAWEAQARDNLHRSLARFAVAA